MTRPTDGTAPGWDATAPASGRDAPASGRDAPASGWDALAVTGGDALSYTTPATDALSVGHTRDALGVWYARDALGSGDVPATADPLAAPVLGDTFVDSLTAYGDATAAERSDRLNADRSSSDRLNADRLNADRRSSDRRNADRRNADRRSSQRRSSDRLNADRRRAPRPGPVPPGTADDRSTIEVTGDRGGGRGRVDAGRRRSADAGRSGPTWEDLNRVGPRPTGSGERYGAPSRDAAGPRSQGSAQPWANRPAGTVPWVGGSGRSGWDDFFAGMGDPSGGSGTQPSGADVARALRNALRRRPR